ncbi:oxygen-independent coproporphyrinogen III oxidase [Siminovitchia acidinfaciens]|uniref:Heme chaperone HemW n=2 Tax=Siminovitchia acidinfaciens TaxID=2321395 RepID=A0A429XYX1_9BACI|nr:radical SAM family heme chaperone HemW [Siminovitchia acidinfaciens]RST73935.1 oxygen-independent coproporphyrinogen III oxidase [Siminovitchia acidinfaciens]
MKSAYIHIPFCEHICHYCDFNKFFMHGQPVDEYLQLLEKEFELYRDRFPDMNLKTIFVGGGTPTALSASQLDTLCSAIRKNLPFTEGEFTFEANPGDLTMEKLRVLFNHGVNRLSFGVQSFNDELLKRIGRSHQVKDVYRSIRHARQAGFSNISIDLIYSLPGQTTEDFSDTVKKAIELDLSHYSGYSLIVEPKTVFYNLMRKGKLKLPGEDQEAAMYNVLIEEMERSGLRQYEISNFAKSGFQSIHNLVYWNNEEYFGFGAGAHGYVNGIRYSNYGPLKKYMEPISRGTAPVFEQHEVTHREKMEEEMFLGLRKRAGVNISLFNKKYSINPKELFQQQIEELSEKGWIEEKNDSIRLTREGLFLGNEVFQTFLLS